MKKLLVFFAFGLLVNSAVIAQNYTLLVGDTAILSVTGANGSIQWQQSNDLLTWTDIIGATSNPQNITVTSTITGIKYYRAKVINYTVCQQTPWYSNIIQHDVINNVSEVQIGDRFRGGIVFLTESPNNGLIAENLYGASSRWGLYGVSSATSYSDGAANTNAIIASNPPPSAANTCALKTTQGYDDWFLPALNQLMSLYNQRLIIGGFIQGKYWSSTYWGSNQAYYRDFTDGNWGIQGASPISSNLNIYCIRSYDSTLRKKSFNTTIANQTVIQ